MDSLLHIETKKQKVRQTDKDFKFHSVSLLSQEPLARGSSALLSLCFPKHSVKKDKAAKILDFIQDFGFFTTNLQIIIIGKLCNFLFLSLLCFNTFKKMYDQRTLDFVGNTGKMTLYK